MKRLWSPRSRDESGAALVLAIVFMVVVGAIGGGMLANLASSQYNRNDLDLARNREYAADGAIETGIAQVRFRMTDSGSSQALAPCANPLPSVTLNAFTIQVSCTYTQGRTLTGFLQRNVIFSAKCDLVQPSGTVCPNQGVITQAQVNFESASSLTATRIDVTHTYIQSWTVGP